MEKQATIPQKLPFLEAICWQTKDIYSEGDVDIGFYRMGFDYSTTNGKWLKIASGTQNNFREAAYFDRIQIKTGYQPIWLL